LRGGNKYYVSTVEDVEEQIATFPIRKVAKPIVTIVILMSKSLN
jgi:hypothetical protein